MAGDFPPALFNLGTLYEQELGAPLPKPPAACPIEREAIRWRFTGSLSCCAAGPPIRPLPLGFTRKRHGCF